MSEKKFNIIRGHSMSSPGAIGLVNEFTECEKVKNLVIEGLTKLGIIAVDCSCNLNTATAVLSGVIKNIKNSEGNIDIHIHMNSSSGIPKENGTEVYIYDKETDEYTLTLANNLITAMKEKGFNTSRGIKKTDDLYVINKSPNNTIVVECFFVNSPLDVTNYNKVGPEGVANAIIKAVSGQEYIFKRDIVEVYDKNIYYIEESENEIKIIKK